MNKNYGDINLPQSVVNLLANKASLLTFLNDMETGKEVCDYTDLLAGVLRYASRYEDAYDGSMVRENIHLIAQRNGVAGEPVNWSRLMDHVHTMYYFTGQLKGNLDDTYINISNKGEHTGVGWSNITALTAEEKQFGGSTLLSVIADAFPDFDINAKDSNGITLLMHAAYATNSTELLHHVLNLGADIHLVSKENGSALCFVFKDSAPVIDKFKALVAAGADPSIEQRFLPHYFRFSPTMNWYKSPYSSIEMFLKHILTRDGAQMSPSKKSAYQEMLDITERYKLNKAGVEKVSDMVQPKRKMGVSL